MAAISAAQVGKTPIKDRAHRSLPRGTVGSVRAGLGGIQEIDTHLITSWGPQDRLELTAVNKADMAEDTHTLVESIRENGQQVPVLLRPCPHEDGRFDVIYGRRRILACRELDIPVKALIRTLDDTEALMAKGLENASRVQLSFYERARFAAAIMQQGYSREATMQALAISKNTLSQLERIPRLVPDKVGDAIGAAPGAGRPKWMALATLFEEGTLKEATALDVVGGLAEDVTSDGRLDAVIRAATQRGPKARAEAPREPIPGVAIKSSKSSISVAIKRAGENKEFADWLDNNIDQLIADSFQTFKEQSGE